MQTKRGVYMENSLHYKLRTCHTNCQKAIVQDIKSKTDLRPGEPKILEFLAEHQPCEQKIIASGCNLDSASVTGILGRMEKRNLVKRETKNGNRRSLYVSMTEYGQDMYKKVDDTFSLVDHAAVKGLSKDEISKFMKLLDIINCNLTDLLGDETIDKDKK